MSLWVFCNHKVNLKTNCIKLNWNKNILLLLQSTKWLKEKASFNNSHSNRHRNYTNRIFNKNIFRSSAALVGWHDLGGIGMRAVPFSVAHRHVFFKAQQRLKEKASSNNSHKNSHRNQQTLYSTKTFSDLQPPSWAGGILAGSECASPFYCRTQTWFFFVFKFLDTIQINTIIFIYPCSIKFIMVQNMQIY